MLGKFPAPLQRPAVAPLGTAGGMSGALFWRITTPERVFVLRRWPREHPPVERLRFIHAVLRHALNRNCPFLPVPQAATTGETFVDFAGHLWELTPWMPGIADYELGPSPAKLAAAMHALADIHAATATFNGPVASRAAAEANAIQRRASVLRELQDRDFAPIASAVEDSIWPQLAPLARQFLSQLPKVAPAAFARLEPITRLEWPTQPCLRDIWHDHVLFTGDRVTGIVDFGAVDFDTPATDVARLLGSLVGDDQIGWQHGLAAYAEKRQLSVDEVRAVTALDAAGTLLAGCNWIRWIYVDKRQFDNPTQVTSRFARLVERAKSILSP